MIDKFVTLVVLAILCEAVWETLKMIWDKNINKINSFGAIIIGIIISVTVGLDIFEVFQIPTRFTIVGIVLTGILISRGANFTHDIIRKMQVSTWNELETLQTKEENLKTIKIKETLDENTEIEYQHPIDAKYMEEIKEKIRQEESKNVEVQTPIEKELEVLESLSKNRNASVKGSFNSGK